MSSACQSGDSRTPSQKLRSICHSAVLCFRRLDVLHLSCRFSEAIRAGRISKVEKISECCILAAVGQQMASRKGVAATMFSALAKANINIRCGKLPHNMCSLVQAGCQRWPAQSMGLASAVRGGIACTSAVVIDVLAFLTRSRGVYIVFRHIVTRNPHRCSSLA